MPKLPRISGLETIKAFEKMGFTKVRQRGSHVVMKKSIKEKTLGCVIPVHKELALRTLRSVLRQADILPEVFIKFL